MWDGDETIWDRGLGLRGGGFGLAGEIFGLRGGGVRVGVHSGHYRTNVLFR